MATIETIVKTINRELVPLFEERLRAELAVRDRDWLVDQVVRLTLDAHSLQEADRRSVMDARPRPAPTASPASPVSVLTSPDWRRSSPNTAAPPATA